MIDWLFKKEQFNCDCEKKFFLTTSNWGKHIRNREPVNCPNCGEPVWNPKKLPVNTERPRKNQRKTYNCENCEKQIIEGQEGNVQGGASEKYYDSDGKLLLANWCSEKCYQETKEKGEKKT